MNGHFNQMWPSTEDICKKRKGGDFIKCHSYLPKTAAGEGLFQASLATY